MTTISFRGRNYDYHLPNAVNPATPAPVVVVLHGLGVNSQIMAGVTGFSALADTEGFIAVYPNAEVSPNPGLPGLPPTIQMWSSGGSFSVPGVDDETYLVDLLGDLRSRVNANSQRTYVVGMSNGAMMAYRITAGRSQHFSAMAAVAGTCVSGKWTPTSSNMSVLAVHGTADPLIKYTAESWHPSSEDLLSECAVFNGCGIPIKTAPWPTPGPLSVEKWDFGFGPKGGEVVFYRIDGGGHTWPKQANVPGLPAGLGPVSPNLDATKVIWEFFKRH